MGQGAASRQGKRQGDFLAGKYLLEDCLGIGGMGEVYRATNVALGRKVAIKLLSPEFAKSEDDVNRFLREARAAAAVRHPSVVDVFDVARDDDGTPFIVQELLAGEDLEKYMRSRGGKISPNETLELMIPVADAMAAAHAQKVVHRDLKPANIFLARDRNQIVPKVLDFGAALFQTIADRSAKEARTLIGTPHYMAPEQIVSKSEVDARSDVWALGVILYEMMVGETPFEAETAAAVLNKVKTVDVPMLRTRVPEASLELEQVVAQCTRRDRLARYPDAAAVRDALEAVRRKVKGLPKSLAMATMDDAGAPPPPRPVPRSAPRIPSIDSPAAPRKPAHVASLDLPFPEPMDLPAPPPAAPSPSRPRAGLLTLSSPDDDPLPQTRGGLSLDIPLPLESPRTPPASAQRPIEAAPRMDPSGVRDKLDRPDSLDISPFSGHEEPLPSAPVSAPISAPAVPTTAQRAASASSLPPVLFTSAAVPLKPEAIPPSAPVPLELREDLSSSRALDLSKARPIGPTAVRPTEYARRIVEQTWSKNDTIRLGASVAIPAIILFLVAGLIPAVSQPIRHALLGDSSLASGVFAVVTLLAAAGLCANAALRERTRLAWIAAGTAVLFGIVMIIMTFGASEAAESGDASTLNLATCIGPLAPLVLALDWLTKARDYWLDPYSRSEARRSALVSAVFLFVTLAFSPVGAVKAPPRPMNAIQNILKH